MEQISVRHVNPLIGATMTTTPGHGSHLRGGLVWKGISKPRTDIPKSYRRFRQGRDYISWQWADMHVSPMWAHRPFPFLSNIISRVATKFGPTYNYPRKI